MDWREDGILLRVRKHGETSAIIDVLTEKRGRHAGVVRGASSRKIAPMLQPGAQLDLTWRARLEDHIGTFTIDLVRSRAGVAMQDRLALAGLNSVTALLAFSLPERDAHAGLYRQTSNLLDLLDQPDLWPLAYLRWELSLLEELGFGLDLTCCAVTGSEDDLRYVSPKSGRAVSTEGAGDWAARLLPLPPVLKGEGAAADAEILRALEVTGHFLTHHLAASLGNNPVPDARQRLLRAIERRAAGP